MPRVRFLSQPGGAGTAVIGLAVTAQLAAIGIFDVAARALPLNDDWVYAEPARRLATGHGLRLFPEVAVPAIPQVVVGAAGWALSPTLVLLRLEALVFAAIAVALVVILGRCLGADPFWAVMAGAALACFPVFAGVSASFMTEPMYLALLLLAALLGVRWLSEQRPALWLVLPVLAVAALDRQHALGIPAALSLGMLIPGRRRTRADLLLLGGCWLATAAGLLFPVVAHLATPRMAFRVGSAGQSSLHLLLPVFAYTPRLVGLLVAPFGVSLGRAAWSGHPGRGVVGVSVLAAVLGGLSLLVPDGSRGTYLTVSGLGPLSLVGEKPQLFGLLVPALKVAAVVAFTALVAAAYRRRRDLPVSPAVVFIVALAVTQAAPMLTFSVYDRYYLPVFALLLPLVALVGGRVSPRPGEVVAAVAFLLLMSGVFVVGQQDYLAWQTARDRMAHQVMASSPAASLFGGYETYGTYTLLPRFEAGQYAGPTGPDLPSFVGPVNPDITLEIAGPSDPRPGLSYSSLAPGRVVLECPRGPCPGVTGR